MRRRFPITPKRAGWWQVTRRKQAATRWRWVRFQMARNMPKPGGPIFDASFEEELMQESRSKIATTTERQLITSAMD